jgi:flagellar biosynthesis/type III secretory pathway chaperone
VKPASAKLENLLKEKLSLLQKMDSFLSDEIAHISEEATDDISKRIERNDEVISTIKNIDYEIARIEASEGTDAPQISVGARLLNEEINKVTQRSESKVVELVEKLGEMRNKAKTGLKKSVQAGPSAGYKPGKDGRAFLADKRR